MDCVDVSFQKDIIIQETYLIGEIIMWPKTSDIPKGFISCDGSSYSKNGKYNKLYGVIGYKFGGSSASGNFNIPNLNVSNTDTPILIKGDLNMSNNSVNQELNTIVNDVSGGVNKITNNILPEHNHDINTNVNTSFTLNSLTITDAQNNVYVNRANQTDTNTDVVEDGSQSVKDVKLPVHRHDIDYIGNSNITGEQQPTINFELTVNQNTSNHENVTPASTLVHYIIFTGVYE